MTSKAAANMSIDPVALRTLTLTTRKNYREYKPQRDQYVKKIETALGFPVILECDYVALAKACVDRQYANRGGEIVWGSLLEQLSSLLDNVASDKNKDAAHMDFYTKLCKALSAKKTIVIRVNDKEELPDFQNVRIRDGKLILEFSTDNLWVNVNNIVGIDCYEQLGKSLTTPLADVDVTISPEQKLQQDTKDQRMIGSALAGSVRAKRIRIFLSSTFEDMINEREYLSSTVFPEMVAYTKQKGGNGWSFEVVDLRWGIRDGSTDDHRTSDICLSEIKQCQETSPGLNFLLLLGDRAGYRPLPALLPEVDFNLIRGKLSDHKLLDQWYVKEENAVPVTYYLKPLNNSTRAEFFTTVFPTLSVQVHKVVKDLHQSGKITEAQFVQYYSSVTENEVQAGILAEGVCAQHRPLVITRHITNLLESKSAVRRKFANLSGDGAKLDTEALDIVDNLKAKVRKIVPSHLCFNYDAKLTDDNITTDHLQTMGREVGHALKFLIDKQITQHKDPDDVTMEIARQKWYADLTAQHFMGRTNELKAVVEDTPPTPSSYIIPEESKKVMSLDEMGRGGENEAQLWLEDYNALIMGGTETSRNCGTLMVVTGGRGVGKRALLAKAAQMQLHPTPTPTSTSSTSSSSSASSTTATPPWVIHRTMGLSTGSNDGWRLMHSVYGELLLLRHGRTEYDIFAEWSRKQKMYHTQICALTAQLLRTVPSDQKLFIFLSGVGDRFVEPCMTGLSDSYTFSDATSFSFTNISNEVFEWEWIPRPLPNNIHIVIGATTDHVPKSLRSFADNSLLCGETSYRQFQFYMRKLQSGRSREECDREAKVLAKTFVPLQFNIKVVELKSMSWEEATDGVRLQLAARHRTVNDKQFAFVKQHLHNVKVMLPLVLPTVVNQVAKWSSLTSINSSTKLPVDVESAAQELLEYLERIHGQLLTSFTLSMLALQEEGITERILRRVLSSYGQVLKDISQYHVAKEVPDIVWSRFFNDVNELDLVVNQQGVVRCVVPALFPCIRQRYMSSSTQVDYKIELIKSINVQFAVACKASSRFLSAMAFNDAQIKDITALYSSDQKNPHDMKDDWKVSTDDIVALIQHLKRYEKWEALDVIFTDFNVYEQFASEEKPFTLTRQMIECFRRAMVKDMSNKFFNTRLVLALFSKVGQRGFMSQMFGYHVLLPFQASAVGSSVQHRGCQVCYMDRGGNWHCFERKFTPEKRHPWRERDWERVDINNTDRLLNSTGGGEPYDDDFASRHEVPFMLKPSDYEYLPPPRPSMHWNYPQLNVLMWLDAAANASVS